METAVRKIIPCLIKAMEVASSSTVVEYKNYIEDVVKTLPNKELGVFIKRELQKLLPLAENFEKSNKDTIRGKMLSSIDAFYFG